MKATDGDFLFSRKTVVGAIFNGSDADADRLSLCRRHTGAAAALHDANRPFFLVGTLLVFFSLIEVLVTTILDNKQQTERAKKIDRYCRIIFPVIFAIASIAIFVNPRN